MRLTSRTFTTSGSWVCPAGVTSVIALGQGGGQGGGSGAQGDSVTGGRGGVGSLSTFLVPVLLTVTPNTTYTITIGSGGAGGVGVNVAGADGGSTSLGGLQTWLGATGAYGYSTAFTEDYLPLVNNQIYNAPIRVQGGVSGSDTTAAEGNRIVLGSYAVKGAAGGTGYGGGGAPGNSSDAGVGGAGGNGSPPNTGTATDGAAAASTSYGAGGGGGGGQGANNGGAGSIGNGGAGAGGRLIILWAE